MIPLADRARITYALGVMDQPGLAAGYPDLVGKLDRLYADRVAKLPWVPASWLAAVREIQSKNPSDLIVPTPGLNPMGTRSDQAPSFVDDDAKAKAWHVIYDSVNAAKIAYAKQMAAEGAGELARLQAAAAFWDAAYKLATIARDLPAGIARSVGGGVADFIGTFLPESLKAYSRWVGLLLGLLIIGTAIMWYKGKLGKLAAGFKSAGKMAGKAAA